MKFVGNSKDDDFIKVKNSRSFAHEKLDYFSLSTDLVLVLSIDYYKLPG
jgi:hypothetical protein